MEALRKLHNDCKRALIHKWVRPGSSVLDCGCGRGGDFWKWKAVRARVTVIDPDPESLREAEERSFDMNFGAWFLGPGDIRDAVAAGPFDVVCYNFALHYIVDSWSESLDAIERAVRPGGLLIGVTPEKERAEWLCPFEDSLGNTLEIQGDRLWVRLTDGPFYAEGAKDEPLLDAEKLRTALEARGFERLVWEPMLPRPNGLVSDLYSSFVFKKMCVPK